MSEEKKTEQSQEELLRKQLFYEQKNGYDRLDTAERLVLEAYCEDYKRYLSASATEREAVREAVLLARQAGFREFLPGAEIAPGDRLYRLNRGKGLMLAVVGRRPLSQGATITAAHIDSPRLDLKPLPLFEDGEMAFFKTHYYGGIKKYQWVTIPMELHGTVALKDGTSVDICIGRDPDDPQFTITDLLIHLASDQMQKKASEAVKGESLNLLVGGVPYAGEGKERVKLAVLSMLFDSYGITEEDLISAELEAVPALGVRDVGLDRSFIGGYGHDDRVCAYAELRAILELETPETTAVCVLADKEEIGSVGATGMRSYAFDCFMEDLCEPQGTPLRRCFENSLCVSADVCNAFDPLYPEVSEKRNNARANYGIGICKYTGARGKSGANDADAETLGKLRAILDGAGVVWQMAELGKVDQGGGGTVAQFMAERNISTVDAGVPVLSMHAPWEVVAKLDCYMTGKAIRAVYERS
ncbi:MAG: aminopeptidase [Oscillospiraceae bacterium]|nr:aminopeptidase [Oscillospiraceae bacterium]